jgi:hypothetical protein
VRYTQLGHPRRGQTRGLVGTVGLAVEHWCAELPSSPRLQLFHTPPTNKPTTEGMSSCLAWQHPWSRASQERAAANFALEIRIRLTSREVAVRGGFKKFRPAGAPYIWDDSPLWVGWRRQSPAGDVGAPAPSTHAPARSTHPRRHQHTTERNFGRRRPNPEDRQCACPHRGPFSARQRHGSSRTVRPASAPTDFFGEMSGGALLD